MTDERFDAFISYSRAASTPLAVALHSGIERFAKPWYRLRASRVFRDDSSMSANTALWSTIENGLTDSGWLVLLASPEAAASHYVADELQWWLTHKSPETVLLVQASGDLFWDRATNRFDMSLSTALPPALAAAFAEQPRWIDMRWFSEEGSLGTADPRFDERVADLTAAIRRLDRDKLVGENVRQHRRVRRLTQAAVTALAILLVASLGAGFIAVAQAAEASTQRDVARDEARVATARQLAATSQSLIDTDLVMARLLADQAFRLHDDASTRAALLQSVSTDPAFVESVSIGSDITAFAPTPDGSVVAIGTTTGEVLVWNRETGATDPLGTLTDPVEAIAVDDSGSVVAAVAGGGFGLDLEGGQVPATAAAWVDGEPLAMAPTAVAPIDVSPSGATIAFRHAPDGAQNPTSSTVGTIDTSTGDTVISSAITGYFSMIRLPSDVEVVVENGAGLGSLEFVRYGLPGLTDPEAGYGGAFFLRRPVFAVTPDGDRAVVGDPNGLLEVRDVFATARDDAPAGVAEADGLDPSAIALSTDGTRVAIADTGVITVTDVVARSYLASEPARITGTGTVDGLEFLADGLLVAVSGDRVAILDPSASSPLVRTYPAYARWLANASPAPVVSLNGPGDQAIVTESDGSATWHVFADDSSTASSAMFLDWHDDGSAYFLDSSGSILRTGTGFVGEESRFPLAIGENEDSFQAITIDAARYVPTTGELVVGVAGRMVAIDTETGEATIEDDTQVEAISPDGRFAAIRRGESVEIVERATGDVRASIVAPSPADIRYEGDSLIVGLDGTARMYTASGSEELASFGESTHIRAAVDDERDLVARYLTDGTLQLSSLTTGLRIGEFAFPHTTTRRPGFGFAGDGSVLALIYENTGSAGTEGTMHLIDLDPAAWTTIACETAGRDLTASEWRRIVGTEAPEDLACGGA